MKIVITHKRTRRLSMRVVHELAHLIEANHSPKFHALMDRYFPRWKEARKITRQL